MNLVLHLTHRMKIYFDAWDRVNEIKRAKVDRQLERMKAE